MLEFALAYLRRGWPIFPLAAGTKDSPLVKWGPFQDRLPTEAEIREWWTKWPDANIAMATGPLSGIAVLDLELEGLQQIDMVANTMTLTGKGKQGFFKFVEGLRNKAALAKTKGYDVRADGGYVVLPPSIHPNGKRYAWALGPLPIESLIEFPPKVLADIGEAKKIADAKPEGWLADLLTNLQEGNRNDSFTRAVGKLHYHGLDKATIWAILLPHAKASNFEESELNSVIQSVTRYKQENRNDGSTSPSDIETFLADQMPVAWLCTPIIAKESIGFVSGLPETFKTWTLNDLAIECARGNGLWLGLFPVVGGRVLFIDQERSRGETQRRFKSLMAAKGLSSSDMKGKLFVRSGTTTRIDLDDSYRSFQNELRDIQPNLILIDSFATFQTGDENDRMSVQKVLERIKEIRSEFKCSIIFIDHENKSAFSDQRDGVTPTAFRMVGSVGKIAAADFILTVRRYDPTTCMVYHTKSTLGPRVPSFTVHVVDTPGEGIRVYGEGGK